MVRIRRQRERKALSRSRNDGLRNLMVDLFINHLLGPLLLVRQKIAQPAQRLLRNHQPRGNHGLSTGHIPIATTLLIL